MPPRSLDLRLPDYAPLWLFAAVLLLSPLKAFGSAPLLLARLLALIVMAALLWQAQRTPTRSLQWSGLELPTALILLGMAISFTHTRYPSLVFFDMLQMAGMWALVWVMLNLAHDRRRLELLLSVLLLSALIPSLLAAYQISQGLDPTRPFTRVEGSFTSPTGLGGFMIAIVTLSAAWMFYPRLSRPARLFTLGVFGLSALALALSLSRGAILGAGLGLALVYLRLRRPIHEQRWLLVLLAGLAGVAMLVSWEQFVGRVILPLVGWLGGGVDGDIYQRLGELSIFIPLLQEHGWLGTGIGNYPAVAWRYKELYAIPDLPISGPHNILMYFLAEVGLVGAAGFFWLLARLVSRLRLAWTGLNPDQAPADSLVYIYAGSLAGLAAYIPFLLTHNAVFSNELWLLVGFSLAAARLRQVAPVT